MTHGWWLIDEATSTNFFLHRNMLRKMVTVNNPAPASSTTCPGSAKIRLLPPSTSLLFLLLSHLQYHHLPTSSSTFYHLPPAFIRWPSVSSYHVNVRKDYVEIQRKRQIPWHLTLSFLCVWHYRFPAPSVSLPSWKFHVLAISHSHSSFR